MNNSFHSDNIIFLINAASQVLIFDWKYLPDNHEIYRKVIEKVNFIDYPPFPAGGYFTSTENTEFTVSSDFYSAILSAIPRTHF